MISFEWPWAFMLLALPWLAFRTLRPASVAGALRLPIAAEMLRAAGRPSAMRVARPLALLAYLALVAAAAQPVWTGAPVALPVQARDLLLVVDLSASMAEKDIDPYDRSRSRLDVVRDIGGDFLRRREGDRVGLVVFGTRAHVYAPLTLDRAAVAGLLGGTEAGLAGDATALGDALVAGLKALQGSRARERVLVLLSDGENTAGSVPPAQAAVLATAAAVRVHTIAVGAEGAGDVLLQALDLQAPGVATAPLREIARRTGGRFFRARTAGDIREIYAELDRIEPASAEGRVFQPRRTLFHWPLAGALLLALALAARRAVA